MLMYILKSDHFPVVCISEGHLVIDHHHVTFSLYDYSS